MKLYLVYFRGNALVLGKECKSSNVNKRWIPITFVELYMREVLI
jgi:hypothetical protein